MTHETGEKTEKRKTTWQRTSVSNLLRNGESGKYYCRVKIGGKQKWKALNTDVLSVAKLRLSDTEKQIREQAKTVQCLGAFGASDSLTIQRFIDSFLHQTKLTPLAESSKLRREIALKAIIKTWPDLPNRDVRRVTKLECEDWRLRAISQGTGFRPPGTKAPPKKSMSPSAFNKCLDALRAVFEIARKEGIIYANPAADVEKSKVVVARMTLPSTEQFREMVKLISSAGARQSRDCADFVRFLAFSGVRVGEAADLRWSHVDFGKGALTVPGTKSETSHRMIPLFSSLTDLLYEIRQRRGVESVELGVENDKPDSPILRVRECAGALQSACKTLGIATITHHDLRHLFATRCIESGVDIPTVSRWLGHSDGGALAMKTYGHLRDEHSKAQAVKVSF